MHGTLRIDVRFGDDAAPIDDILTTHDDRPREVGLDGGVAVMVAAAAAVVVDRRDCVATQVHTHTHAVYLCNTRRRPSKKREEKKTER